MANYPNDFDALTAPNYNLKMDSSNPTHSTDHEAVRQTVIALQTKVGKNSDTNPNSLDNRIYVLEQNPGGGTFSYASAAKFGAE